MSALYLFSDQIVRLTQWCLLVFFYLSGHTIMGQDIINISLPNKPIIHTAYLVGDSGGMDTDNPPNNIVLSTIKESIKGDNNASLYFLGDNIYPVGLRDSTLRVTSDSDILGLHIDLAESIDKKSYMIPGNHDWASTSLDYNSMVGLNNYLVENSKNLLLQPANGCPDPYVIKISKDHIFILIDSQWWVENADDENLSYDKCEITSRHAFALELESIFFKHKNDQITVLLHHPLMSNGNHGGNFSFRQHLFPITDLRPNLYIPLPMIGSILPIYRNLGINKQDVSYHWNKKLKSTFDRIIANSGAKRILFISGHEHSQQLFSPEPIISKSQIHHLISGSGYKQSYVRKGGNSEFVSNERGYQKLYFYTDGSVWLDIIAVSAQDESITIFRSELFSNNKQIDTITSRIYPELKDSVNVRPSKTFKVGKFGRFFVGDQYRDVWKTKIKVPVIDLQTIKGGLVPVKLGGGASSNSLRLVDHQGREYILRSVVKTYKRFLKNKYSDIIWLDYYGDENASALPYGTLSIGKLSDAIDIPHSNPKLYYLAHQEALGPYNEMLEEGLYMLENRPDGKLWSNQKSFGYAPDIVSNNDMRKAVMSKATHKVDQQSVLKARLFDMWVHDWDRHADQWRWSKNEVGKMTTYKPIPRDRDWVFFKYDGLIYSLIGKYIERKHSSFKNEISDLKGLNISPAHFDRANLNELEWEQWEKVVAEMQENLTDELIYNALSDMPEEILPIVREEILGKLIIRRNDLDKYALEYYKILSKEVSIVGTDNKDFIQVTPLVGDSTKVSLVSKRNKKKDIQKYSRSFSNEETKVIRIYGLQGKDKISIDSGYSDIDIQFIGGLDIDKVNYDQDASTEVTVYDNVNGIEIPKNKFIKSKLSNKIANNRYDPNDFKYNSVIPTATIGSTFDEGLWLGVGFIKTFQGFRKSPFASKHALSLKVAPFTAASLMLDYSATYNIANSDLQLLTDVFFHNPDYVNFFGIFNERNNTNDSQFNRVKLSSFGLETKMRKFWNRDAISVSLGPYIKSFNIDEDGDRIIENYDLLSKTYDDDEFYVGSTANLTLTAMDNLNKPSSGFKYSLDLDYNKGIDLAYNAINIYSDFVFYLPVLQSPDIVFAGNLGFATQYGSSDWYMTPSIGANNHLRSLRNDRLRGESIYYHQFELRSHMVSLQNRFLPMDVGITVGYEGATATYNDTTTSLKGLSIGLSMNIADLVVIHPYFARAEKLNAFGLSMGFKY